jgi:hypothetical protein
MRLMLRLVRLTVCGMFLVGSAFCPIMLSGCQSQQGAGASRSPDEETARNAAKKFMKERMQTQVKKKKVNR